MQFSCCGGPGLHTLLAQQQWSARLVIDFAGYNNSIYPTVASGPLFFEPLIHCCGLNGAVL